MKRPLGKVAASLAAKRSPLETIRFKVGSPVTFKYPGNEGTARGILKERAAIASDSSRAGVPYWDVVHLIEFACQAQSHWLRIGYYQRPKDRPVWAVRPPSRSLCGSGRCCSSMLPGGCHASGSAAECAIRSQTRGSKDSSRSVSRGCRRPLRASHERWQYPELDHRKSEGARS